MRQTYHIFCACTWSLFVAQNRPLLSVSMKWCWIQTVWASGRPSNNWTFWTTAFPVSAELKERSTIEKLRLLHLVLGRNKVSGISIYYTSCGLRYFCRAWLLNWRWKNWWNLQSLANADAAVVQNENGEWMHWITWCAKWTGLTCYSGRSRTRSSVIVEQCCCRLIDCQIAPNRLSVDLVTDRRWLVVTLLYLRDNAIDFCQKKPMKMLLMCVDCYSERHLGVTSLFFLFFFKFMIYVNMWRLACSGRRRRLQSTVPLLPSHISSPLQRPEGSRTHSKTCNQRSVWQTVFRRWSRVWTARANTTLEDDVAEKAFASEKVQ